MARAVSAQDCESRNPDLYLDLQTQIYLVVTRETYLVRDAQAHLHRSTSAASSGGGTQRIARTLRARRSHEQLRLAYTCTRGPGRRWRMAADSLLPPCFRDLSPARELC
jgi:hypothetical protein